MKKGDEPQRIEVWADWSGLGGPVFMGALRATPSRGKEIFLFEYDQSWLGRSDVQNLDPALKLYSGPQYTREGKANFGLFLDSSPDRWGRVLLNRREAQKAREEGRKERGLKESDYLLGVYDGHRLGALRFRKGPSGPFLDANATRASPPWTSLRQLEQASLHLESDDAESKKDYAKWLEMLVAPGTSLGGARPKASVLDPKSKLWIAKFPSRYDDFDTGAWEQVVHKLGKKAGVIAAHSEARKFSGRHHTFLTQRFDRTENGDRLHFASAMTLLEHSDGDDYATGASYLELVEFLIQNGAHVDRDLEQLWRRIIFFICVSNVDDHLRNHGFMLVPGHGWSLAPAYDINPDPKGEGLKLNISETDNAQSFDLALGVAKHFRVKLDRAKLIIEEVSSAVKTWRKEAGTIGISHGEQDRMASAFRNADET